MSVKISVMCESWQRSAAADTDLGVLVGCDGGEGRLREGEGLENAPADAEEVICLHDVEARVVAMHGVQDDLQTGRRRVIQSTFSFSFCECQRPVTPPLMKQSGDAELLLPGLVLTWPCWSSVLLVSLSLRKETDCFIQWLPGAGESGWR